MPETPEERARRLGLTTQAETPAQRAARLGLDTASMRQPSDATTAHARPAEAPSDEAAIRAHRVQMGLPSDLTTGERFAGGLQSAFNGLTSGMGNKTLATLQTLTPFSGDSYEDNLSELDANDREYRSQHPHLSTALNMGGGIVPAIAAAPERLALSGIKRLATSVGTGAGMGALQGAGAARGGLADDAIGAAKGGAIGAALALPFSMVSGGLERTGTAARSVVAPNADAATRALTRVLRRERGPAIQAAVANAGEATPQVTEIMQHPRAQSLIAKARELDQYRNLSDDAPEMVDRVIKDLTRQQRLASTAIQRPGQAAGAALTDELDQIAALKEKIVGAVSTPATIPATFRDIPEGVRVPGRPEMLGPERTTPGFTIPARTETNVGPRTWTPPRAAEAPQGASLLDRLDHFQRGTETPLQQMAREGLERRSPSPLEALTTRANPSGPSRVPPSPFTSQTVERGAVMDAPPGTATLPANPSRLRTQFDLPEVSGPETTRPSFVLREVQEQRTPAMRLQTSAKRELPAMMPDLGPARQGYAQQAGEIRALGSGSRALKNALSRGVATERDLGRSSVDAFADKAAAMPTAERARATQGILGAVDKGTGDKVVPGILFNPKQISPFAGGMEARSRARSITDLLARIEQPKQSFSGATANAGLQALLQLLNR